jgi:uncharacterized protein YjbI with pentapeptide repeats
LGARLQGADLGGAQLQGAILWVARLQGANLGGAQLQGANLQNAQLQGADLQNAQLQGADLQNAQLQGANLQNAQLQGADLWDARLQGANLGGARLQGADLRNARLQGVYTETLELLNFEQRIEQQIDRETESQNLEEQYEALNDTNKSKLIAELKAINSVEAKSANGKIIAIVPPTIMRHPGMPSLISKLHKLHNCPIAFD